MEDAREYEVKGELTSPEPEKKKKRHWWVYAIDVAIVALFLLSIAVSVNVIYLSSAYNMPFFVNGMSMYPTLNADATDSRGNVLTWRRGSNHVGDHVDYGYAKTGDKDNWFGSLQRYDIVIAYYPDNYERDESGNYIRDTDGKLILLEGAKTKIKRLIGFPGESVDFQAFQDGMDEVYRAWGKTTIDQGLPTEKVLDNLYTMKDFPDINGVTYNYPTASCHYELKENEYFVMGDNRGNSSDCREKGPILGEMIIGKAYLVIGKRELDQNLEPKNDWGYIFTPWLYRRIG